MKVIKLSLVPDQDVPEFKRMAFTTADRPLREVLLNGLHPVGLTRVFDGYRDISNLPAAVAERLNRPENILPGLQEFGHSQDVDAAVSSRPYGYGSGRGDDEDVLDSLKRSAERLYFVDSLSYPELVELARLRLSRVWTHEAAKAMLTHKFGSFNDQRRFLKEKDADVTLKAKGDMDGFDLAEILAVDDFRNDDKLLVIHGIPGSVNFRLSHAVGDFTTPDGVVSIVPRLSRFEMHIAETGAKDIHTGNSVRYMCSLLDGKVRLIPELNLGGDKRCREKARTIARELGKSGEMFCFSLEIEEAEKLLGRARIFFPALDYTEKSCKDDASFEASIRADVAVKAFIVGPVVTDRLSNKSMSEILDQHEEKVSGTKDEMVERLVSVMVRLYSKSKGVLARYFRHGYMRVGENTKLSARVFEPPIDGHGLRDSVVALYVLKHMRGSRILSPKWENTAYTVEDLARALMARRVSVEGVFVRTGS